MRNLLIKIQSIEFKDKFSISNNKYYEYVVVNFEIRNEDVRANGTLTIDKDEYLENAVKLERYVKEKIKDIQ